MANSPKKKVPKKIKSAEKKDPAQDREYYCFKCGTAYLKQQGSFQISTSFLYKGSGFLPICNSCVEELYDYYCKLYDDDRNAMRRICMIFDIYWNEDIFTAALQSVSPLSLVRRYISKTNTNKYAGKTYETTIREDGIAMSIPVKGQKNSIEDSDIEIPDEVIDFWGAGYTPDFYLELERRYAEWTNGVTDIQPNEKSLYRQICLLETIISRDGAQGKAVDKNINTLNTLLGSMNLKPAQKKSEADLDLERMPLGVGIQKWEETRPLPPTPDDQKDVSGLIKNINTWYLGHTCKMVGLKNSYCKMYEDAMEELRVKHPEYNEEDDDTMLNDIFGMVLGE